MSMIEVEQRICATCGAEFIPNSGNQRHCGPACTSRAKVERENIRRAGLIPAEQLPRCPICGRIVTAGGGAVTCGEDCRRVRTAILKRQARFGKTDPRLAVSQSTRELTEDQWLLVLKRAEARSGERTASLMLEELNARRTREGKPALVRT